MDCGGRATAPRATTNVASNKVPSPGPAPSLAPRGPAQLSVRPRGVPQVPLHLEGQVGQGVREGHQEDSHEEGRISTPV